MKHEINLDNIGKQLKKQWYLILILPLLFNGLVWLSHEYVIPKTYQSKTQLLMLPNSYEKEVTSEQRIRVNMQLVNTLVKIVKSPKILDQVKNELHLTTKERQLLNEMDISADENSLIITLTVKNTSPSKVKEATKLIADNTKQYMEDYFPESKIEIFESAQNGEGISYKTQYAIAILSGIWIALCITIITMLRNNQIGRKEDLKQFGFPVFGSVPVWESRDLYK